jgi:hypothetical protein
MGAACKRPTEMQHIPYVLPFSLFITSLPFSSLSFFLSFFLSFSRFLSSIFLLNLNIIFVGRYGVVGIAIRYGLDGQELESRWWWDFLHPAHIRPGTHPALYKMVTGFLCRLLKRPTRDVEPTSCSTEVKERVQLYLYSPSGSSWPVIGRNLSLPLPLYVFFGFLYTLFILTSLLVFVVRLHFVLPSKSFVWVI